MAQTPPKPKKSPTRRSPAKSPAKKSPSRKSPTRTSPRRYTQYGGLSSATLAGTPLTTQQQIASYLQRGATASMQSVSRGTRRATNTRLREICAEPPSYNEVSKLGREAIGDPDTHEVMFIDPSNFRVIVLDLEHENTSMVFYEIRNLSLIREEIWTDLPYNLAMSGVKAWYKLQTLIVTPRIIIEALSRRKSCLTDVLYPYRMLLSIVDKLADPYIPIPISHQVSRMYSTARAYNSTKEDIDLGGAMVWKNIPESNLPIIPTPGATEEERVTFFNKYLHIMLLAKWVNSQVAITVEYTPETYEFAIATHELGMGASTNMAYYTSKLVAGILNHVWDHAVELFA